MVVVIVCENPSWKTVVMRVPLQMVTRQEAKQLYLQLLRWGFV